MIVVCRLHADGSFVHRATGVRLTGHTHEIGAEVVDLLGFRAGTAAHHDKGSQLNDRRSWYLMIAAPSVPRPADDEPACEWSSGSRHNGTGQDC